MSAAFSIRLHRFWRHLVAFPGVGYEKNEFFAKKTRTPVHHGEAEVHLFVRARWVDSLVSDADLEKKPFPHSFWWRWLERIFLLLDLIYFPDLLVWLSRILKPNTRKLKPIEEQVARQVFGDSLPYHKIRIDERAFIGPMSFGMAYVSFRVVNCWGKMPSATFIHELVHVWQYQQFGSVYIPRALWAQSTRLGYDYGGIQGLAHASRIGKRFQDFNYEQQGDIMADYFCLTTGQNPTYCRPNTQYIPYFKPFLADVNGFEG